MAVITTWFVNNLGTELLKTCALRSEYAAEYFYSYIVYVNLISWRAFKLYCWITSLSMSHILFMQYKVMPYYALVFALLSCDHQDTTLKLQGISEIQKLYIETLHTGKKVALWIASFFISHFKCHVEAKVYNIYDISQSRHQ